MRTRADAVLVVHVALPSRLSLPEEFALLAHRDNGTVHDSSQVVAGCAEPNVALGSARCR
ncbi:hypothetical protein SAMN05216215_103926 [Saccharopolyspora shandongensis]|uniref:Uncharacterized protein n=1 Tax=Saccharopolyspora shandongensis TaxID=418495 RepID=A0A1H3NVH6_9PSEU|nr:hypothetical protein [Saccharopolyspora shandongensis]SDY92149.1 hypothetical protein SAMN05216215_103926 [Saccharopolyspora shandongensis]